MLPCERMRNAPGRVLEEPKAAGAQIVTGQKRKKDSKVMLVAEGWK